MQAKSRDEEIQDNVTSGIESTQSKDKDYARGYDSVQVGRRKGGNLLHSIDEIASQNSSVPLKAKAILKAKKLRDLQENLRRHERLGGIGS